MKKKIFGHICLITALFIISQSATAAPVYELTNLGNLGGSSIYPMSVNNNKQVVGEAKLSTGETRAFYWDKENGMINLGTLNVDDTLSQAYRINDLGQIVGRVITAGGNNQAVYYENSNVYALQNLTGGNASLAYSINNSGMIVGYSNDSGGTPKAVSWTNSSATPQKISDLNSYATNLNNSGITVGTLGSVTPVMWDTNYDITYLPDTIYQIHHTSAINEKNQIAGWAYSTDVNIQHTALYWDENLNLIELPIPGWKSVSRDINESGYVVGDYFVTGSNEVRKVFLWHENEGFIDLNNIIQSLYPGWSLSLAWSINDYGDIVATGIYEGQTYAVMLSPLVPEPCSFLLVTIGFLTGLIRFRFFGKK